MFTLSAAFVTTGLGKRIAYLLIGKIGNTTLGLGYVTVSLILYWLLQHRLTPRVRAALCHPSSKTAWRWLWGPNRKKSASCRTLPDDVHLHGHQNHQLYVLYRNGGKHSGAENRCNDILHLQISWGGWALAAGLPGIIMLLVTPLVIYTMYPPEIKKVDNKTIAKAGLAELGPMKIREKMLLGVFVLALLGWIFSKVSGG